MPKVVGSRPSHIETQQRHNTCLAFKMVTVKNHSVTWRAGGSTLLNENVAILCTFILGGLH